MKSAALVFLAAFIALASSWSGFVLAPQLQLGLAVQTNVLGSTALYPLARPGLARQGAEVYRANGCVYCHSQQVGQEGVRCDVVLTDAGTNITATQEAISRLTAALRPGVVPEPITGLPKTLFQLADVDAASPALKALESAGAKAELHIVPTGRDIARGWGKRRTVAQDYLYDSPVQPGGRRIGPDLANVGARLPDANWHYRHLYAPGIEVKDSKMPPYRYLFETRKVGREASPEALKLPPELAPAPGLEIVPRENARALVAYLLSLRADAPLFEAPLTPSPSAGAATNLSAATPAP